MSLQATALSTMKSPAHMDHARSFLCVAQDWQISGPGYSTTGQGSNGPTQH